MAHISTGHRSSSADNVSAGLATIIRSLGETSRPDSESASKGQGKSAREDNAYADDIDEIVRTWVLEDMDITASVYKVEPQDLFEDVLALIVSETPVLHKTDPDYAGGVSELLDWFLEDIVSVGRSFDLDPVDVFEDVLNVIISDTPLADRILAADADAEAGSALGGM